MIVSAVTACWRSFFTGFDAESVRQILGARPSVSIAGSQPVRFVLSDWLVKAYQLYHHVSRANGGVRDKLPVTNLNGFVTLSSSSDILYSTGTGTGSTTISKATQLWT